MANNNPSIEKRTAWGYTEEEVEHRWKVHMEFDPLNRLFGSGEKDTGKQTPDNSAQMEAMLGSLFPQQTEGA